MFCLFDFHHLQILGRGFVVIFSCEGCIGLIILAESACYLALRHLPANAGSAGVVWILVNAQARHLSGRVCCVWLCSPAALPGFPECTAQHWVNPRPFLPAPLHLCCSFVPNTLPWLGISFRPVLYVSLSPQHNRVPVTLRPRTHCPRLCGWRPGLGWVGTNMQFLPLLGLVRMLWHFCTSGVWRSCLWCS